MHSWNPGAQAPCSIDCQATSIHAVHVTKAGISGFGKQVFFMSIRKFYLTEASQIVFFDGRRHRCLGHLACVMHDQTPIAREAQAWWRDQLASDEPILGVSVNERSL